MSPAVEAPVALTCGECGDPILLSARNARGHRVNGTIPKCRDCHYGRVAVNVTRAMRQWWLDRFTLDEIRELGRELDSLAGSDREYGAWETR